MTLYDILFRGKEVKKLIVKRSFDTGIPLRYICLGANINYVHFMGTYINSNSSENCKLSENDILRVLDVLGVSLRYQFLIDENYNKEEKKLHLKNKYDKRRKDKVYGAQEKGTDSLD
jgi:hypothetical protein